MASPMETDRSSPAELHKSSPLSTTEKVAHAGEHLVMVGGVDAKQEITMSFFSWNSGRKRVSTYSEEGWIQSKKPRHVIDNQEHQKLTRLVSLDVEDQRSELSQTTVFAFVEGQYPPPQRIKRWFMETRKQELEAELLGRGFLSLHLNDAIEAGRLVGKVKLDYNNSVMHLFPWIDDFDPREPSRLLQPVWVRFPFLPLEYRKFGLAELSMQVGKFICYPDKPGHVIRVCVGISVKEDGGLIQELHLKTTNARIHVQQVEYERFSPCEFPSERCSLVKPLVSTQDPDLTQESQIKCEASLLAPEEKFKPCKFGSEGSLVESLTQDPVITQASQALSQSSPKSEFSKFSKLFCSVSACKLQ